MTEKDQYSYRTGDKGEEDEREHMMDDITKQQKQRVISANNEQQQTNNMNKQKHWEHSNKDESNVDSRTKKKQEI